MWWFSRHTCIHFIPQQDMYPAEGIPHGSVMDDAPAHVARVPSRGFFEGVAVSLELADEVCLAACPEGEEDGGVDYFHVDSEGFFARADEAEEEAEVASVGY